VTFASHFLFPSVRWYLRRRLEHAVAQLNQRLDPPDPTVQARPPHGYGAPPDLRPGSRQGDCRTRRSNDVREDVAFETWPNAMRARSCRVFGLHYFSFAIRAARFLSQSLYRVRLVRRIEDALAASPRGDGHLRDEPPLQHGLRAGHLARGRTFALAYAVGEWARVWPLSALVRAMGGYFIRRRYNNPLYRKVLARYVQMATEAGVTQAVFPEGGLSRTGALGKPKLGLISYILDGFQPGQSRDVVFVPVAINYDRVMEDRNLIEAQQNGSRAFRFSIRPIYRYLRRQTWLRLTGKFHRYGYAAVCFGEPLSLTVFLGQPRPDQPKALGEELMVRIAQAMPVTPVPLVSHALVNGATTRAALEKDVAARIAAARARGATIHIPRDDLDYTIEAGLRALTERRFITIDAAGTLTTNEPGQRMAAYYAASVAHLLDDENALPIVEAKNSDIAPIPAT
jgi:glycerol-3-phosphate O-acyltransferase